MSVGTCHSYFLRQILVLLEFSYDALDSTARSAALNGTEEDCHVIANRFYDGSRSRDFEVPVCCGSWRGEGSILIPVDVPNRDANRVSGLRLNLDPLPASVVGVAGTSRNPGTSLNEDLALSY